MHPSEGTLRRYLDEPDRIPAIVRAHLDGCVRCNRRLDGMARTAEAVSSLWRGSGRGRVPGSEAGATDAAMSAALRAIRSRETLGERGPDGIGVRPLADTTRAWAGGALGVGVAVALGAVLFTPVGSYASQLLTVFEPQQVQAVAVPKDPMSALPDLAEYGTVTAPTGQGMSEVPSAAMAASLSGAPAPVPSVLPPGVGSPTFEAMKAETGSFTFRATRAAREAARMGETVPPMPASLNGSTLTMTVGPGALVIYPGPGATSGGAGVGTPDLANSLVAVSVKAPKVTSTGASAGVIEQYLLSLPGVTPTLKADIEAIQNPTRTLPVPIPAGQATSAPVSVNGASGLMISDTSGLYHAVIWQQGGRIEGVAGPYTEAQVLAAARSLGQG